MEADGYIPPKSKTAMNMRDNRIYRNAVKGGIVQQNVKTFSENTEFGGPWAKQKPFL